MPISMSTVSLPTFRHYLCVLSELLHRAEMHANTRSIQATALLGARLYPDMFPLTGQVQLACDFAKGAVARLSGVPNPRFADDETNFVQLQERIKKTLDFIATSAPEQIDGSEERTISLKFGKRKLSAGGRDYLIGFAIPNFIFHVSIAYAILRHNGIEIGKSNFLGSFPGIADQAERSATN